MLDSDNTRELYRRGSGGGGGLNADADMYARVTRIAPERAGSRAGDRTCSEARHGVDDPAASESEGLRNPSQRAANVYRGNVSNRIGLHPTSR